MIQPLYPDVNFAPDLTFLKQAVYNVYDQRDFFDRGLSKKVVVESGAEVL